MKFSSSLKLNHIFRKLYHTKGVADGYLVLYARRNRTEENRIGITVSKKLGKAHVRNRTRRRLREVYRINEHRFRPGWDIVVEWVIEDSAVIYVRDCFASFPLGVL